jgi:hypothetical protein
MYSGRTHPIELKIQRGSARTNGILRIHMALSSTRLDVRAEHSCFRSDVSCDCILSRTRQ